MTISSRKKIVNLKKPKHRVSVVQWHPFPQRVPQTRFTQWVNLVLDTQPQSCEVAIAIVSAAEGLRLNQKYRHKNKPTNVLSFPCTFPLKGRITKKFLGDIILCAPVIVQEATLQHRTLEAHLAHLVIHGVLHLLGFDHIKPKEAAVMESLEIQYLATLGFPNPYEE